MDRLTERDEFGNADIIGVDSADLQLNLPFDQFNLVTMALNLLAAYEDTGMTPDEVIIQQGYVEGMRENLRIMYGGTSVQRLMELAKADKEGRCVVLPYKEGDWVYLISEGEVVAKKVQNVSVSVTGEDAIFLTREAAEAALKERENNG